LLPAARSRGRTGSQERQDDQTVQGQKEVFHFVLLSLDAAGSQKVPHDLNGSVI
jgi:hypothetical protein